MSLLLKDALINDLRSPFHLQQKNIFIKDGIIADFKTSDAEQIIDCKGKTVTPGWLDLNADFCDPGFEFKEDLLSGSKAASLGGFTDVHLIPRGNPVVEKKGDVEYLLANAREAVDLHVAASISEKQQGENLTEMLDLHHFGAVSFADGDQPVWNAELLLKALQYTTKIGVPIFQNARDLHLSNATQMHEGITSTLLGYRGEPSLSESLVIQRDLELLKYAGGKIHFTKISTAEAVDLIRRAKEEGLSVTCDVAIYHLLFTDERIQDFDTVFKSLPPFRSENDRLALIEGIKEGVIDAICSNHRPQDSESKELEFDLADPGSIALQTFPAAALSLEEIPFEVVVEKVTHGPRGILGLDYISVKEGAQAKLTIIDPDTSWVLDGSSNASKSINSPFWKQKLTGKAVATINKGLVSQF